MSEPILTNLFSRPCDFVAGAADVEAIPPSSLPEVTFIGRSNVGKSSLLNALTGRKALARVSRTPGRTRQINFFNLADTVMLVDVPGYGFAEASKQEIEHWKHLTRHYLLGRPQLRRAYVLVDSRHGLKAVDTEIMELLDKSAVSYQLVLTKCDKLKAVNADAILGDKVALAAEHPALHPEVIATSSLSQFGVDALREAIVALLQNRG